MFVSEVVPSSLQVGTLSCYKFCCTQRCYNLFHHWSLIVFMLCVVNHVSKSENVCMVICLCLPVHGRKVCELCNFMILRGKVEELFWVVEHTLFNVVG